MDKFSTTAILEAWPTESVATLVAELADRGLVTDEDGTGLSSVMIEGWNASCDTMLRLHGFAGGVLRKAGNFFPWVGAIYCLYDSERMTMTQALGHLDQASKKYPDYLADP